MRVRVTFEIGVFEGGDAGDAEKLDARATEAADSLLPEIHHSFPDVTLLSVERERSYFKTIDRPVLAGVPFNPDAPPF